MAKKINIAPVDQAKVIIGDLSVEDLESVVTYSRFILQQKKRSAKKAPTLVLDATNVDGPQFLPGHKGGAN